MEVRTEGLGLSFGEKKILEDISIQAKKKEFVGIIGPNGSGKSTLLKNIYRVLKPDYGEIFLDDSLLSMMKAKESAKRMAVVSQHNFVNFDFSVEEMVLMGRAPHKRALDRDNAEDYQIMHEVLRTVGLEDFAKRGFMTLSGGEQQRVILARALAQKTDCIILDEPTNHLDIKYQLQLMEIVKNLKITVIAAIHDLNMAALFCDKIYVLSEGRIIKYGSPKEVLTRELIREVYEVEAEIMERGDGKIHIIFSKVQF